MCRLKEVLVVLFLYFNLSHQYCKLLRSNVRIIDKSETGLQPLSYYCYFSCNGTARDSAVLENSECVDVSYNQYYYPNYHFGIISNMNLTYLDTYKFPDGYKYIGMKLSNNGIQYVQRNYFRSYSSLREIDMHHNNITTLPVGLFASNDVLTVIDLSYNNISVVENSPFPLILQYLFLQHNRIKRVDFELPKSLLHLDLSFNLISYVQNDSFAEMTLLETLYLHNNSIQTIPTRLFKNLNNAQVITLQHNQLQKIDFTLPKWLTRLDLSFNIISYIYSDSFSGMTWLKTLCLQNNFISTIPAQLLKNLSSIEVIKLQHNNITHLPSALLPLNNSAKIRVDLSYNNISRIERVTFFTHGVEYLNLQNNRLQSLNFTLPLSLTFLDLSCNEILYVHSDTFFGMNDLRILKMNNNFLTELPTNLFKSLANADEISLQHNKITSISDELFTSESKVDKMDLSYNQIVVIETNAFSFCQMRQLNLTKNNLNEISFNLPSSLKILDLSSNNISKLNTTLQFLHLNLIDLSYNNIETLPNGLFSSETDASFVNLSFNNISKIEKEAFPTATKMQCLSLHHNKLQTLDFQLPDTITELDLSFNGIFYIETDFFLTTTSLKTLRLNNNNLKTLPNGLFRNLATLNMLSLANNTLTLTFGMFRGLKSLTDLDISNNSLKDFPELILNDLQDLSVLNIEDNSLSALNQADVMEHLKNLRQINLKGNRFQCVDLLKLIKQFNQSRVEVREGNEHFASNVRGIRCGEELSVENKYRYQSEDQLEKFQTVLTDLLVEMRKNRPVSVPKNDSADNKRLEAVMNQMLIEMKKQSSRNDSIVWLDPARKDFQKSEDGEVILREISENMSAIRSNENSYYLLQTLILLTLLVVIVVMFYFFYKKTRNVQRHSASLTEMSNLEL